jgi:hypothetical protein
MNYQLTNDLAKKHNIPLQEMIKIRGIDDGYESYMIYKIMDDYHNMTPEHNKHADASKNTIELTNDLIHSMERIAKRDVTKCVIQTYENLLHSRNYAPEEKIRITMWLQFVKHIHANRNTPIELIDNKTLSSRTVASRDQGSALVP